MCSGCCPLRSNGREGLCEEVEVGRSEPPPHCQAVMIAFMALRRRSISRVTSGEIRTRTATNDRERGQLQPELQPPKSTGSLLHTALTRPPPAAQPSNLRGHHRGPMQCRATPDCLPLVVRPPAIRRVEAGQRPPADARTDISEGV